MIDNLITQNIEELRKTVNLTATNPIELVPINPKSTFNPSKPVSQPNNDVLYSDVQDGEVIEYSIFPDDIQNLSNPFSSTELQKEYVEIQGISSWNAWEYLKSYNLELIEPLWLFLYNIKIYLHQMDKHYRLSIHLDENLEEPDFKMVIILIETDISNLDEDILLTNEIGEIIDQRTTEILSMKGEEFNEKLAPVIYQLEKLNSP